MNERNEYEPDLEMDRIISGVFGGVLPVLDTLDLNTENDDLRQLVEGFADRVWDWFDVEEDDVNDQIAARVLEDMS